MGGRVVMKPMPLLMKYYQEDDFFERLVQER